MAKTKKKMKAVAKKKAKAASKKATKSSVKKKVASAARKKTKSPAKKKVKTARNRRAKSSAPRVRKITTSPETTPEIEKQNEVVLPAHVHKRMDPQMAEDSKKLERRFLSRKNVTMNAENQKVKSAMAKRQSMKPIYHGLRGG